MKHVVVTEERILTKNKNKSYYIFVLLILSRLVKALAVGGIS